MGLLHHCPMRHLPMPVGGFLYWGMFTRACLHTHACLHTRACLHTCVCLLTYACLHTLCISRTCHRERRARQHERERILDCHQVFRTRMWDRCNKVHDHAAKFSIFTQCKSHQLAPSPGLQSLLGSEEDWGIWAPHQRSPGLSR